MQTGNHDEPQQPGPSPALSNPGIYFENLNSIRFIAALLVIITHVEQLKAMFHLPNHFDNPAVYINGRLGVVLFFVLSGFLITYLLLEEQATTGTINLAGFYMRRILRIWPLYFLTILVALLCPLSPHLTIPGYPAEAIWQHLGQKILMFIFFLPNLVLSSYGVVPFASQTWSIGTEEQFYLIWPVLNRTIRNKQKLVAIVIVSYLAVRLILEALPRTPLVQIATSFWQINPLDCLAIGGWFAVIARQRTSHVKLRAVLFTRTFQWMTLLLTMALVSLGIQTPYFYELYAVLFGILVSGFACADKKIFSMENRIMNYLGRISYGMYMYHPLVIVLCIRLLLAMGAFSNLALYSVVMFIVVVVSAASYEGFEKRFVRMKVAYSAVISGDNARLLHSDSPGPQPLH